MSVRKKTLDAIRRRNGSYIPFEFCLCPSKYEEFMQRTGSRNYVEYYKFPLRGTYPELINLGSQRFEKYYDSDNIYIEPEWGVGHVKGSMAHFTKMVHPMEKFECVYEILEYPFPDANLNFNWEKLERDVKSLIEKDTVVSGGLECTIFETAWHLRGMENLFLDMTFNEDMANCLLDRITEIKCTFARMYAKAGCDILRLGDDVSTQLDMMMSPDMWKKYLKGRLEKVIACAKEINPDIFIFYHGDGNLTKIIPDLIEIGVEILNPVQPECMDPLRIKDEYKDKLTLWGTLGTQTLMPFGTPSEVRDFCMKMIDKAREDNGGLVLAPTHVLEPEVPFENILAFVETVKVYNGEKIRI